MKLLNRSIKARIYWLLATSIALLLSLPVSGQQTQKKREENTNTSRWEYSDSDIGLKRRFESSGKVEFNDDYTDIANISDGGWAVIEEHRGRQSFRYEVRPDAAGKLTRAFFVNGVAKFLDASGKEWLSKFVLDAVRQGGIDAEKRVNRLLSQRGVNGVLAEIEQIHGDYGKRIYYEHLIKQANLDGNGLRDVLKQMARDISSDYEQAQLLTAVSPLLAGKPAALQPFFDAVATIKSDYERGRVLKTLLKQDSPTSAMLVLVASSTKTMSSDYERHGVLSALIKIKTQSEEVLRMSLDSATAMSSDYEKATFLVEISNTYSGDTRLRSEFLKAAESIKSEYERGRVLSALLKNRQLG